MSACAPLELQVRCEPDATVISVCGEIDLSSCGRLREEVLASLVRGATVLDLAGVGFCDSTGVRVLVEAERVARAGGVSFRLAAASPAVERVLEVVGALELFEAFPDLETALRK